MSDPSETAVKTLFALSRNLCFFNDPDVKTCEERLTDPRWKRVKARIAHIRGEHPGSARYDPNQPDADRQSFENLLLLCPGCHTLIDELEPVDYPVERLQAMKERHLEHHAFEQWASEEQVVRYASMALVEYRATQNQAAVVSVPALEITPAEIHRRAQEAMPQPLSRTDMVRGGADSGRSAPNPISGLVELASQVRVERAHDGGVVVVNDGPYTVHQPSVVEVAGDWSGGELDAVAPAVIEPGTMWRAGFLPAGHGTSPTRPAYRVQLTWCDDGGLGLHLYERSLLFDL